MDEDTNPVMSPFSGTGSDAASTPADAPVSPATPPEPPWHAPSLPAEPAASIPAVPSTPTPSEPLSSPVEPPPSPAEPVVPAEPEAPASSSPPPPAVEPSFPPPPPEKPAEPAITIKPKKSNVGKAVVLGLLFFILAVGGVLGYLTVQQGGLPFGIGKKAEGGINACDDGGGGCCDSTCPCRDWEVCDVDNGACASGKSCRAKACSGGGSPCSENWQCCSGNCSGGTCSGGSGPTSSPSNNCDFAVFYSGATQPGFDCAKGSSASVKLRACLPKGCEKDLSYKKVVANCPGKNYAGCGGACGAEASTATLHVNGNTGDGCSEATVSCSPPNACGSCQVDIDVIGIDDGYPDGYGVRRWQDSGCGQATPTPTPTLTPPAPCCTNLTLAKIMPDGSAGPLTDLQVGDRIKATITFSGTVEDVVVRVKRGGTKIVDMQAHSSKTNNWSTEFTIPSAGQYEILGFVRVGGTWK